MRCPIDALGFEREGGIGHHAQQGLCHPIGSPSGAAPQQSGKALGGDRLANGDGLQAMQVLGHGLPQGRVLVERPH